MSTALDRAHNAIERKLFAMKGFHYPAGSQAAFLTGLWAASSMLRRNDRLRNT